MSIDDCMACVDLLEVLLVEHSRRLICIILLSCIFLNIL